MDVRDARNYTALDIAQEAGDENQPIISYLSHVMGVTSSSEKGNGGSDNAADDS